MTVQVRYQGKEFAVESGATVEEFLVERGDATSRRLVGFKFGPKKVPRDFALTCDGEIVGLTLNDSEGIRIYKNSVIFLVIAVFKKLYPHWEVVINHTISGGIYCTVTNISITPEVLKRASAEVRKMVDEDLPFESVNMATRDAVRHFEHIGWKETAEHLRSIKQDEVVLFRVDGQLGFVFGSLVPSTGFLQQLQLQPYASGFILRYPRQGHLDEIPPFVEQPKLFAIFREYERWQGILALRSVADLNRHIVDKKINEIIHVAESLHEKKIAVIADDIAKRADTVRCVLIAGPSSSGKTTFSKRLAVHLKVNGINTLPISLDDYFRDRTETPRDENGEYDFESIYALNLDLFNNHLVKLLSGETIELPKYDFGSGKSVMSGKKIKADPRTLLIIEGIHGLNDELTPAVYQIQKYRVYVSAFTPIGLDNTNRIPTTDLRLMRRIVRDNFFRSYSAADTLMRWPLVRHGEKKWIFPHQNKADLMFNSTLIYEPAVLKTYAQPLLEKIQPTEPVYEEAQRLREFLSLFEQMDHTVIPGTSILREFIGNSHFKY
jgi:uridine kinase